MTEKENVIKRLFVPLNKIWYNLFKSGSKLWEIRAISSRFNENTVYVGREVELRNGYRKEGMLLGKISDVTTISNIYDLPENISQEALPIALEDPMWEEIEAYNEKYKGIYDDEGFIVFKIKLES